MTPDREASIDDARLRWRKAQDFADSAELHISPDGVIDGRDVFVTLAVHAGIAAADVICIMSLSRFSPTGNHAESVALLAKADKDAAKHLERLLRLKSKAGYAARSVTGDEAQTALRAYRSLIDAAAGRVT